jgi:hypothetical protein
MQDLIEFFVLSEVVPIDPNTHAFPIGMALLDNFVSQFHRWYINSRSLFSVNWGMRQLVRIIVIIQVDGFYTNLAKLIKFFDIGKKLVIKGRDAALSCHFIFMNEFINDFRDSLIIISFANDCLLRGLDLYVNILPFSYELEELFKCGHLLSIAHVESQDLFISQIENVNCFLHLIREMMI